MLSKSVAKSVMIKVNVKKPNNCYHFFSRVVFFLWQLLKINRLNTIIFLLSLIFLSACQHNAQARQEKEGQQRKLDDAAAYNTQLGMAYLKQDNPVRARHKLLMALHLAPKSPDAHAAMGYLLEKTGDLPEAKSFYQQALALAPHSGAQLNNYGIFLCRTAHYKEAEQYFLKAVGDVQYLHRAGAYENAGLCAAARLAYSQATIYFAKALEQDPQRKQSLLELAKIELKQEHPEKALNFLQKYDQLVYADQGLLRLAVKAAHQSHKPEIEASFKQRLSQFNPFTHYPEDNHEYDNTNG